MIKEKEQKVIVGAIIHKEGKFLIVKRAMNDKIFPGKWELPSGRIEFGEKPEDAIRREVKEETDLDTEDIEYFNIRSYVFETRVDGKNIIRHNIDIAYLIKPKDSKVKLSDEHEDFCWIDSSSIKNYDTFKEIADLIKKAELKLKRSALL